MSDAHADGAAPTGAPDTRPRLLHLTTTDMSLDWLLGPQLCAFADAGYEVIGASAPGPHVDHLTAAGIRHIAVPSLTRAADPLADVRALIALWRLCRRERPDIVHTHNPKPGVLGRIAARLAGVPLVVNTQHGLWAQPTDRRRRRWPVYTIERIAATCSHAELVQNPEDLATLVDRLHVPARRVHLLGNGIDLARFTRTPAITDAAQHLRAEWIADAPADTPVIGVVGRLVAEKGIPEVLAAAHLLHERGIAVRVVVIGPADPDKPDALDPALVRQATVEGVRFVGQRTDMPACYAAMDVFVTASRREGFPRAAMEAAAMGLPIVATDIRGNRQVVIDGETGALVPLDDPTALAAAIERLVTARDRWPDLQRAARQLAESTFDQQWVIERTLAVYRTLGARRTRRRDRQRAQPRR
ncbi:MAG: glycosyltransferase family 4 protein [Ilumatobacteraceae bacterium]